MENLCDKSKTMEVAEALGVELLARIFVKSGEKGKGCSVRGGGGEILGEDLAHDRVGNAFGRKQSVKPGEGSLRPTPLSTTEGKC